MSTNMSAVVIVGALVVIVSGLITSFFGYRVYRSLFVVLGCVAGAVFGYALADSIALVPGQEPVVRIILAVLGGIVGASLSWFRYLVYIFLLGAGTGGLVGAAISRAANAGNTVQLIIISVLAIVAAIIAVTWRKPFIVVVTSFIGGRLIVYGMTLLLRGVDTRVGFNPWSMMVNGLLQGLTVVSMIMLVTWLVFGIGGVLVQSVIDPHILKNDDGPTPKPALETRT